MGNYYINENWSLAAIDSEIRSTEDTIQVQEGKLCALKELREKKYTDGEN